MKTKKKTNQRQRRKTRARRVKRGGGGGLHQRIKDEKELFNLLNVSGLTPPDSRKTSIMLEQVLQMLETRMLLLKQYNDVHGFLYIDKDPRSFNKRMSPSIHNIVKCFGALDIIHLSYIKSGFDAEKRLHQLLKTFMATMKALKFHACMQYEFKGFGGSFNLANVTWVTTNHCKNLSENESMALDKLSYEINSAIQDILNGMRSQIHLLYEIKTNAIPAMEKAYREKDRDEWEHVLWETIPAFLHPDGDKDEFRQHMERFKRKIDDAIAQKENALNSRVEFVDPLNLSHLSHRTVPSYYAADGVLQPARAPKHAVAQIAADIASYDPDITQAQRMSQMRGLRNLLIHRLTGVPIDHAKLQSNFYHPPEKEEKIDPPHLDNVD